MRYWLGKLIQFPIGERWLVISASAAIGGASFTFLVMPVLALISGIFVFRGRIRKTREWERTSLPSNLISSQLDLLGIKSSFTKRASWIEPSVIVAIECLILTLIFMNRATIGSSAFLLIFSIFFNHYDNLYRALQGESKPNWLTHAGLYVGGRTLLVAVALTLGWPIEIIIWYFALLFFGISSMQWVASHRAPKKSEKEEVR